jgi:rhamnose utilization protein RhaD (predicted bifunctional aldolase and dehydrogenase)
MHPDAVIAIAAMENSRALTQTIFGGTVGWLPWRRPGFELGMMLQRYVAEHPGQRGLVLAGTASSPGATTRAAATRTPSA